MFDDLSNDLGSQKPKTPVEEAWHNEQRRKSFDIIRVKNPTNEDFYIEYDTNQYQKVPANATIDIPRHMAVRYIVHMKDKIINGRAQKMHDDYLKEREAKGLARYTNKYEENKETYETAPYPKTDDPKLIKELFDELWVGVVNEAGKDRLPQVVDSRSGEVDMRSAETQVMDTLANKRVAMTDMPPMQVNQVPTPPEQPVIQDMQARVSPFSAMNERLSADEITANE